MSILIVKSPSKNLSDDPMMPNIEDISDDSMIAMMIIAFQTGRSSINQSESRIFGLQPIGGLGFAKNHEPNIENPL